jgi:hypothetical protein
MALRYEQGPVAELARRGLLRGHEPEGDRTRAHPEAIKQESASAPAQAGGGSAVVAPRK